MANDTHPERVKVVIEFVIEMPNDEGAADERADEIGERIERGISVATLNGVYAESVKVIDWTSEPLKEGE